MIHQNQGHSTKKYVEWLTNIPIKNDKDCKYIIDTVIKLIQFVSFSNQEERTVGTAQIDNLQFKPSTPVSYSSSTPDNSPVLLKMAFSSVFFASK